MSEYKDMLLYKAKTDSLKVRKEYGNIVEALKFIIDVY